MADGVNERFDFGAPLPALREVRAMHFMAMAGRGVSAVARLALAAGLPVSGSDEKELPVLADLRAAGAKVSVGYSAATGNAVSPDATVVVSSHIRESNDELAAMRARGLRILHRSQGLAVLAEGSRTLAVAGASGKTTTSAMAVSALRALGADPSYAIGDDLAETRSNAGSGTGDVFVVEADESDGSFVVYGPQIGIVTNITPDHLDFYGTFENVERAYARFAATIRTGGLLVTCVDDPGAARLADACRRRGLRVVTYGHAADADVRLGKVSTRAGRWGADVQCDGWAGRIETPAPGEHNVANAAAVFAALVAGLGYGPDAVVQALAGFSGVRRRFEVRGTAAGVTVIDDYAHNADKVRALVRTAAITSAPGRLVALFQPHLYSRTRDFAPAFAEALAPADVVCVMDVYGAREDPLPGVTSQLITDAPALAGRAHLVGSSPAAVVDAVVPLVREGDTLVLIGAGDVSDLAPALLSALDRRR